MKKAAIEDIFVGPFAMLALLTLLLIFWVIFVSGCGTIKSISQEALILEESPKLTSPMILNYLRTPVNVNENKITIADLINLAAKDEKYKAMLESQTKEILDSIKLKKGGWNIEIKDDKNNVLLQVVPYPNVGYQLTLEDDSVTIPLYDKNAIIRMYEVCQTEKC